MRWLGQAQRAFDLMCNRLNTRMVRGEPLGRKQLMQKHVFDSYAEIQVRVEGKKRAGWARGPRVQRSGDEGGLERLPARTHPIASGGQGKKDCTQPSSRASAWLTVCQLAFATLLYRLAGC